MLLREIFDYLFHVHAALRAPRAPYQAFTQLTLG